MTIAYQSTSLVVMFKAFLASDHVTEATGKTIAITISKNGGAFGNPNAGATNATEVSSGWYKFTLDATDTNTIGPLAYRGAVATIDDVGGAFYVIATLATPTNITAGTLTTVTNLTNLPTIPANWLTAAGTAADFTTEIQAGLATAASIAALNNLSSAQVTAAVPTAAQIAAATGTRQMTESYAADGAAPTLDQAMFQLTQYNQDRAIVGTDMKVKKLDGTTDAMTLALDSATAPTTVARTA